MIDLFEIVGGSVLGRDHRIVGKNNQDAYYWTSSSDALVAIVCDGCSEGAHSEIGAQIGARLIAESILKYPLAPLDTVYHSTCAELRAEIRAIGRNQWDIVKNYFLFTVVGALINKLGVFIFFVGDGIFCVNGDITKLGPFPDNAPPYLAYNLLGKKTLPFDEATLRFTVHRIEPHEKFESLLIGTDGIADLITQECNTLPGKKEAVGPLSQFWTDEHYFKNKDAVRRKLALMNREYTKPNWEEHSFKIETGLLRDDTTLVVIRRKNTERKGGDSSGSVYPRETNPA